MLLTQSTYAQTTDDSEEQDTDETLYLYTIFSSEAMVYSFDEIRCIMFCDKGIQVYVMS